VKRGDGVEQAKDGIGRDGRHGRVIRSRDGRLKAECWETITVLVLFLPVCHRTFTFTPWDSPQYTKFPQRSTFPTHTLPCPYDTHDQRHVQSYPFPRVASYC
jgi:hypothetical protein